MDRATAASPNALTPDVLDLAFAAVFAAIAVLSWAALVLAEFGWFSRASFVGLGALAACAVAWWVRRSGPIRYERPSLLPVVWIGALLAAGGLALFPPADPVVGGADETLYLNLGSLISHRGGLVVTDPLLAATPAAEWPELFSRDRHWPQILNRFDGGIQAADGDPRLAPNFSHLTPAWIAGATVMGGEAFAPYAVPMLALLAPVALFLAARRMASQSAAMAASALLAVNAGHAWVGRLPLSEVPPPS